ncbi:hypothetical protein Tco_1118024 [Tanacetum coccineum]
MLWRGLVGMAPCPMARGSNVGFAKWSSDTVKKHEAHSNGHVLDDVILSDPEGEGHHETPLVRRVKFR